MYHIDDKNDGLEAGQYQNEQGLVTSCLKQ